MILSDSNAPSYPIHILPELASVELNEDGK